jgi:hypothetical protein
MHVKLERDRSPTAMADLTRHRSDPRKVRPRRNNACTRASEKKRGCVPHASGRAGHDSGFTRNR